MFILRYISISLLLIESQIALEASKDFFMCTMEMKNEMESVGVWKCFDLQIYPYQIDWQTDKLWNSPIFAQTREAFCLFHTSSRDEIESSTWIFYHRKMFFLQGKFLFDGEKMWNETQHGRQTNNTHRKYKLSLQWAASNVGCERSNMINGYFIQGKLLTEFQCSTKKEGHERAYWISLWLFEHFT